jgi:hypothetical protein
MFDALSGVERQNAFAAALSFEDPASADRLATALRSQALPAPMRAAIEELVVTDRNVRIRFRPVAEVELTTRGSDHVAACVLGREWPAGAALMPSPP